MFVNIELKITSKILILFVLILFFPACRKTENVFVPNNTTPNYKSIPTVMVENYVNRLYIDLLGREATDVELDSQVAYLRRHELADTARIKLIKMLQWDSSFSIGDSSYKHAYFQRIYDLSKARFLEGANDDDMYQAAAALNFAILLSRLEGDSVMVFYYKEAQDRYYNVLNSKRKYRLGIIGFEQMCAVMLNNEVYETINMNSFNYVNASYDDLFGRIPTKEEFKNAYDIIEYNKPAVLFGKVASNKNEYCKLITESDEFYEYQIRWAYYTLLQRGPSPTEVINLLGNFQRTKNFQNVQLEILKTDEYAQFRR